MEPDRGSWVDELDAALRDAGTTERAERDRAYLKSSIVHYGVTVPTCRVLARAFATSHPDLVHDRVCGLVGALWAVPVYDRRRLAVELLELFIDRLGPDDVAMLERLLRESLTWALVDQIAANVVGTLVPASPELGAVLDRWATDDDVWIRRASMLALLKPLRAGGGDFDRFSRYADHLLGDREFFIRKAIGWVLRDTAKRRPDLVYDWLLPRAARASGVTVREAVKPLSAQQRAAVQVAHRASG